MGPNLIGLVSLEEEIRTQICAEGSPHNDTKRRRHPQAEKEAPEGREPTLPTP